MIQGVKEKELEKDEKFHMEEKTKSRENKKINT